MWIHTIRKVRFWDAQIPAPRYPSLWGLSVTVSNTDDTFCKSLYSGVFRTLYSGVLGHNQYSTVLLPLPISASPHHRLCTSPRERLWVWWPHNLTLFTTSLKVREAIFRVRRTPSKQANKHPSNQFGCFGPTLRKKMKCRVVPRRALKVRLYGRHWLKDVF